MTRWDVLVLALMNNPSLENAKALVEYKPTIPEQKEQVRKFLDRAGCPPRQAEGIMDALFPSDGWSPPDGLPPDIEHR